MAHELIAAGCLELLPQPEAEAARQERLSALCGEPEPGAAAAV